MPLNLFISYSHHDKKFLDNIIKSLAVLKDNFGLYIYYDNNINAGENLWDEIDNYINKSDIYIAIISPDYLSSNSCKKEMDIIFNERKTKHKIFVPIIARECAWQDTKLSTIKLLPYDGKPIANHSKADKVYTEIYNEIKKIINTFDIKLKNSYIEDINMTDLEFNRIKVKLSDIFIQPKLNKMEINGKIKSIKLDSDFFTQKDKYLFIVGDTLSGKTSILYELIINADSYDIFPLYIDASKYSKTIQHEKVLSNIFNEQYEGIFENYFRKEKKVILIDNYNEKVNINFIKFLMNKFDYIIMCTTDEKYNSYFVNDDDYKDFNVCHIQAFNNKNTYKLLDKISHLKDEKGEELSDFNIEIMENQIKDVILDRKVVPTYPSYIILMVNVFSRIGDIQISSYGDCYLALLVSNLNGKGIDRKDINDSAMNYLIFIAYNIFCLYKKNYKVSITYTEYQELKAQYIKEYSISNNIINRIENSDYKILNISNDKVFFHHQYVYYFLAAKGIISFNDEKQILEIIENLINEIETIHSSYILLFITHHYKNANLIHVFKSYIENLLIEDNPFLCTSQETDFLKNITHMLPTTIKESKNTVTENKLKIREEEDNLLEYQEEFKPEEKDIIASKLNVEQALQSIRVAGQIIKNWTGTYKKDVVYSFLVEIEHLAFRVLHKLIHSLNDDEVIDMLVSISNNYAKRNNKTSFTKENISPLINLFSLMFILSIVSFLYQSISTKKIIEIQSNITCSYDFPIFDFILLLLKLSYDDKALDVDYIIKLNKKFYKSNNVFACKILSLLVQIYIDTHDIHFRDKQKLISEFQLMSKTYNAGALK